MSYDYNIIHFIKATGFFYYYFYYQFDKKGNYKRVNLERVRSNHIVYLGQTIYFLIRVQTLKKPLVKY